MVLWLHFKLLRPNFGGVKDSPLLGVLGHLGADFGMLGLDFVKQETLKDKSPKSLR